MPRLTLHEFNKKLSDLEKKINEKIAEFKNDHPILNTVLKELLSSLPPPFDKFALKIYNEAGGSEEDKSKQVLECFRRLELQNEQSFNEYVKRLDSIFKRIGDLEGTVAKETTAKEIQQTLSCNEVMAKQKFEALQGSLDDIKELLMKSSTTVSAASPSSLEPALVLPDLVPAVGLFVDREKTLSDVKGFFADDAHKLVILGGFFGVGKTHLAAKFAQKFGQGYKAVFWISCSDQLSLDVFLGKIHSFFEKQGEQALRGLWNDPNPNQMDRKIKMLIQALNVNSYLLVFDDFQNWVVSGLQDEEDEFTKVLNGILSFDHKSKILLISDRRFSPDPSVFTLPFGCEKEITLPDLDDQSSTMLLEESGLLCGSKDLPQVLANCGGNPHMMQIFSYLVNGLHMNPKDVITSGKAEEKFASLIQAAVRDLSAESEEALGILCALRFSVTRSQVDNLVEHFNSSIGPLLDRFLVVEDLQTFNLNVPTTVRNYINKKIYLGKNQPGIHHKAAEFCAKTRGDKTPDSFEDLQLALEEAYHRFQALDVEEGAKIIVSVSPFLIDWGYIDLAEQNIDEALKKTSDPILKAECLYLIGSIADLRANYPYALKNFNEAQVLFKASDNWKGVSKTLFRIGRIYNALSKFKKANEYFDETIETCKEHSVMEGYAASVLNKAWNIRHLQSSFDPHEVIDLYNQSILLAEQSNDFETLSNGHRQIGFLMWKQFNDINEAKRQYEKALEISQKHQMVKEIGSVYSELGYLYGKWLDGDNAEKNSRQAIATFKRIGNAYGLCSAYVNLGKALEMKQQLKEAEFYYNESRTLSESIHNAGTEAYAYIQLGRLFVKQNQVDKAKNSLLNAKRLCEENGLMEKLAEVQKRLQEIDQQKN